MSSKPSSELVIPMAQRPRSAYRIFIADRDSMSSDLLASALVRDNRYEASAIQPSDLLRLLATREADVVVIGADSDSGIAFDLAKAVCLAHPDTYVVILTNQTTSELVVSAFQTGARGLFSRQRPVAEFLDCIDHVGKGFIWAGKEEADALLEAIKQVRTPNSLIPSISLPLTARELETVMCAAKGKTNKSIASELGLSEHTVKNYLFRAFEKLGVSSRVELLLYLTVRGHRFDAGEPGDPSLVPDE